MNEPISLAKIRTAGRRAPRRRMINVRVKQPMQVDGISAALFVAPELPPAKDKTLFTPGPLTTSLSVKQAMLHDAGSWHFEFNDLVRRIREQLLALAGVARESGFEAVLMQGTGTFGVESVLATVIPPTC